MRNGFTLLELLIVVVIIGILASLALPRFGNVQEKAYVATMQSDLRNFVTSQALFAAEADAGSIVPLTEDGQDGYESKHVDLYYSTSNSATDYVVEATHEKASGTCQLTVSPSAANQIVCN